MTNEQGKFIVIEGIDGAGTTTQSKRLVDAVQNSIGVDSVIWTCEPSKGPVGQFIRAFLKHDIQDEEGEEWSPPAMAMAHLFTADRQDHLVSEIEPALMAGRHVICDRYYYSTLGYQALTMYDGRAGAFTRLAPLLENCAVPDLVVVLDVGPAEAARRRSNRKGRREQFEVDELQVNLAGFYRNLPILDCVRFRAPGGEFVHVHGSRSQDAVFQDVLGHVRRLLKF
jgi:dTMP kinase